ncbi:MAG: PhzF family phenazine biosynthesis protein, partial [Bacillota bacterium]|nr:PhzF family phenazine biosynthesis protein [Bacillota bacterium]
MNLSIYQVDAFTDKPFFGNPAAVCVLPEKAGEDWMQKVAMEMNLSETAFLYREGEGYNLRWFTPTTEVDLCGHATLASAHILWEKNYIEPDQEVEFYSRSGLLTAKKNNGWIELNFPLQLEQEAAAPAGLVESLGVKPLYLGYNLSDYLVEVESEETLKEIKPDFGLLGKVQCRGVIVTCKSNSQEYDFISRFFAPAAGVNEDPVTGSAHCCLGPYWQSKLNKYELVGYQASARGGVV